MGHIARRRRKSPLLSVSVKVQRIAKSSLFARGSRREDDTMTKTSPSERVPKFIRDLWHLPDSVRWMDPLPSFHRRGIILAVLVVLLAFLWPSSQQPPRPIVTERSISTDVPMQAELNDDAVDNQATPAPATPPVTTPNDSQGTWRNYTIASGQTLAQLFRDNSLPVGDVFAMAQVEGNDKPLSNLQTGQTVRIRQNAQGVINGLTVDTDDGQILFTRQPDGSFLRVR